MKRLLNVAIAAVILLALIGYMITYTVRFNEAAIITTFGRADESSVKNAPTPGGRPGGEAGIHFKLPWPIQQVARKYDTRVQVLEANIEQFSTVDRQSLAAQVYVAWRVTDPLAFYRKLGSMAEAEATLRSQVRDSYGLLGNYSFDQLINPNPDRLQLTAAENAMQQRLQSSAADQALGIAIEEVGIKKIVLPATVTQSVFSRMRAERARLAQSARSEGEVARSSLIRAAESDAQTIQSFADVRAEEIEAEGRQRAEEIFARFAQDEEFAIFLIQLDTLRETLGERTRFILDASLPPFNLLRGLNPSEQPQQDPGSTPSRAQQAQVGNQATGSQTRPTLDPAVQAVTDD